MTDMIMHDDRDTIIAGLREQLRQCREELQRERHQSAASADGAAKLRTVLSPLYNALQAVFGEIDAMGITGTADPVDGRKKAVWESWKQKFPGTPAKFIDALLLHGALTQTQLRIHAQCAQGSVAGVVSTLWKAGIINKNGGKISLKDI